MSQVGNAIGEYANCGKHAREAETDSEIVWQTDDYKAAGIAIPRNIASPEEWRNTCGSRLGIRMLKKFAKDSRCDRNSISMSMS